MNIYPFLHFFVFLVYCYLLVFLLWKDPKSLLNRVCAVLLACFAVWSFGLIFIYDPSASKDTAMLFDNIGSMGWISFSSFFLWFTLIFTEKKKILKTRIIYPFIFILPLLLIYEQWTGFLTADYIKQTWGWESVWSDSIWVYLFYLYYLSFMVIGLYLILSFGRKTEEPLKKKQAKIIFVAALVSLILSTLTDIILPELNIRTLPSSLANVIILIWASGIVYSIVKYKLMVITPITASENIISTIADSLILLDREGNIVTVNKATLDLSGYKKDELEEKSVEIFFAEKDFKNTLLGKAIKGEVIRNYELNFKTKTGDNIPVIFSSSTMMDEAGGMAGIVCIVKDITERKQVEEALQESEQRFRDVTENTLEWVWEVDVSGKYVYSSPVCEKILGYKPEELLGKHFYDLFVPEEQEKLKKTSFEAFANKQPFHGFINLNISKSGKLVWISTSGVPILDKKGKLLGYRGVDMDITKRKQIEETIRKSQQEFASLFHSSPEALVYLDENSNILNINPRFTELFGYTLEEVKGRNIGTGMIHSPDKIEEGKRLMKKSLKGNFYFETIRKKKDGTLFPVAISGSRVIIDGQIKGLVAIFQDITERKKMEQELQKLAHYDILTGSCSRGYGFALLEQQIKAANRNKTPILLLYLDVDNFKYINDTFGHQEGDKVLKESVKLFKSTLREIDIICRMGGDEFLLIFPDSSSKETSLIRSRLEKNLSQLNKRIKKDYQIKFSMGFSEYLPDKPKALDELINIADQRMYEEKKKNKG